jgi:hypothetical protein
LFSFFSFLYCCFFLTVQHQVPSWPKYTSARPILSHTCPPYSLGKFSFFLRSLRICESAHPLVAMRLNKFHFSFLSIFFFLFSWPRLFFMCSLQHVSHKGTDRIDRALEYPNMISKYFGKYVRKIFHDPLRGCRWRCVVNIQTQANFLISGKTVQIPAQLSQNRIRYTGDGHPPFARLSRWFLARLIFRPWRWTRYVPPKRRLTLTDYTALYSRR